MPTSKITPTFISVYRQLRVYQMSISKRDGEYCVNFHSGAESTAYYTNDIIDARDTGIAMRRQHDRDLIAKYSPLTST